MIEEIDKKIIILLKHRDSESIKDNSSLRASICNVIEKSYFLQSIILKNIRFKENINGYFFTANVAVLRHFRDWNLDEVADIYSELREIALKYMD